MSHRKSHRKFHLNAGHPFYRYAACTGTKTSSPTVRSSEFDCKRCSKALAVAVGAMLTRMFA